jgi:hypothetical protein
LNFQGDGGAFRKRGALNFKRGELGRGAYFLGGEEEKKKVLKWL